MTNVVYRFDYYGLMHGPKQGGFVLSIPTHVLVSLLSVPCTDQNKEHLATLCEQRLQNLCQAKMLKKSQIKGHRIALWGSTPIPRVFSADPVFGGSLGANPENFDRLNHPDAIAWIGDEVEYTHHNVDSPVAAMVMTVQIATWGEWAQGLLFLNGPR